MPDLAELPGTFFQDGFCGVRTRREIYSDAHPNDPAPAAYEIYGRDFVHTLLFQRGPVNAAGSQHGITNEALIAILLNRLAAFQSSPFACEENDRAYRHLGEALQALKDRTANRRARGVEGTHEV